MWGSVVILHLYILRIAGGANVDLGMCLRLKSIYVWKYGILWFPANVIGSYMSLCAHYICYTFPAQTT